MLYKFHNLINSLLERYDAPIDTKRRVTVRPKGKYGTINPQLNEPHSTKAISGFMGQPGGKQHTLFIDELNPLKKKRKKKKKIKK